MTNLDYKKRALVLAGGLPQIELLNQLRDRGIYTILADGSDNCVAREYADKFVRTQIFDIDAVKQLAIDEKVDFLITVCADQVLLVVAQVSEMLGLPCYIDYETAQNVSDKMKMKRIFKENGIPTTDYVETSFLDMSKINQLKYPLVVKPIDAYSSKGVRKVENEEQLKVYYEEAAKISRTNGVIVEEYYEGEEISVDAFITDGKAQILCISNSDKIKDDGRFVIYRGKYPIDVSKELLEKIVKVAQEITDAFKLRNAPLLIQLLTNGKDISVVEFCARTGGNTKYLLIKYSCGVDVICAAIDLSLNMKPEICPHKTGNNVIVNDFIYCKPGVFDHLEGFQEMQDAGYINEYHSIRASGAKTNGVTCSSDRIATFNIIADSKADFNRKLNIINENVKIVDCDGNDLMRHDLLPDWN